MKGNKELTKDKNFNKLLESNSDKYIQLSSYKNKNKIRDFYKNINKKNTTNSFKEKEIIKKLTNSIKVNQISQKNIKNNDLIKSYSYKKKDIYQPVYNINQPQNLSSYKKILDKMVQEYASDENSKENINKLLKRSIANQKYSIIKNKTKFLSPSLKKTISKNKIEKNKIISHTGDNRSINKRNKNYINNIIKIQSFWRGFYLRKIVVSGLKKYYGLIFIYKLLKKYVLKKRKIVFDLLKNKKLKYNISDYSNSKCEEKTKFLYTKKLVYNNGIYNSEKNSFSFSNNPEFEKTNENINERKTKTFYSNDKKQQTINSYYSTEIKKPKIFQNRLTNSTKTIDIKENTYNNIDSTTLMSMNKVGNNLFYSSIIKNDKNNNNIGQVTLDFFKKYESETSQPISIKSEYFFRKPIYKNTKQKKRYIYINKNINKVNDKNFSSDKNNNYNTINNIRNKDEKMFHLNNTFYNVYKYVFLKIINLIKKKVYQINFQYFLYQLKTKRKIEQLKSNYLSLLSIIQKIEKKRIKKYLDIYRENVLTLRANELLRYETIQNKYDFLNKEKKNKYKKKFIQKTYNKYNRNHEKDKGHKTDFKNNIRNSNKNNIKFTSNKKDILIKLLKIKNKYIGKINSKYFHKWLINSSNNNNIKSKNNFTFQKIIKYNINLNNNFNTVNNESNKIHVNKKRQLKIIKVKNLKSAEKSTNNSLSKEKKMRIIKRISNPEEYIALYNTYSKNIRNNIGKINNKENNITVGKIFNIIDKLESKKILFKFFNYWKKMKK